jgi:hypothetical protein
MGDENARDPRPAADSLMSEVAHDEDGSVTPAQEFPFQEIFARDELVEFVGTDTDLAELSPEQLAAGLEVMDKLLKWVWQSGMKNSDGVKIRVIILCWICLKELRSLSLTDMATGYGMDKQSLGRWVDDFKRRYPTVRIPHMRS